MQIKQSIEQPKLDKNNLFSVCALVKGKIYSFTSLQRIPMTVDLQTRKIALLENLANYDFEFSADDMLSVGDNIFILELNGRRLMRYSVAESKCSYFNIDCNRKNWGNYAAFAYYGRKIYIFPIYSDSLVKVDLESGTVQKERKLYSNIYDIKKNEKCGEEFEYFWCGCQKESRVWLFPKQGKLAVAYDMESDTWQEYELSEKIENCVHVIPYAGKLYILSAEGKVYCWNMMKEVVKKVADCSSANSDRTTFSRIAVTNKTIFILPALGEDIFCIDLETEQANIYASYPEDFQYCAPKDWSKYYGYCEDEYFYYFAMRSMKYILSINKKDGKEKWIKPEAPFYEEYRNIYIKNNKKMLNETICNIEDILDYLQKDSTESQCEANIVVGENIWRYVQNGAI